MLSPDEDVIKAWYSVDAWETWARQYPHAAHWQYSPRKEKEELILNTSFLELVFQEHPAFKSRVRLNKLTQGVEYSGPLELRLGEVGVGEALAALLDKAGTGALGLGKYRAATLENVFRATAEAHAYHPVQEYLKGLEGKWDGVSRLKDFFADYCGAQEDDNEAAVTSSIAVKFFVGAVARALKPGTKMDNVLVLEGAQGTRKSSFLEVISRGHYVDVYEDVSSKDATQKIQGAWVVELSELGAFSRTEQRQLKGFFSRREDTVRMPYARAPKTYPRGCVFVATTNEEVYLDDDTGNRRYWPVRVGDIDLEAVQKDLDAIWSEAVHLFQEGTAWWSERTHSEELDIRQASRNPESGREADAQRIREAWSRQANKSRGWTMTEIAERCFGFEFARIDSAVRRRVGRALRCLGWTKRRRFGESVHTWAPFSHFEAQSEKPGLFTGTVVEE